MEERAAKNQDRHNRTSTNAARNLDLGRYGDMILTKTVYKANCLSGAARLSYEIMVDDVVAVYALNEVNLSETIDKIQCLPV